MEIFLCSVIFFVSIPSHKRGTQLDLNSYNCWTPVSSLASASLVQDKMPASHLDMRRSGRRSGVRLGSSFLLLFLLKMLSLFMLIVVVVAEVLLRAAHALLHTWVRLCKSVGRGFVVFDGRRR